MTLFTAGESLFTVDNLQTNGKAMPDPVTGIVIRSTIRLAKFLKDSIFISIREESFCALNLHSFASYPKNESELKNIRPFIPKRRLVPQDSLPSLAIKEKTSFLASTTPQRRNIMILRFLFSSLNLFRALV